MSALRLPDPGPNIPTDEDFRSRVARERRQRMRERLLRAAQTAYLHCPPGRSPVIDDVVRLAEVSRGSFYKHYDTLDALLAEIGQHSAVDMIATFERLFGAVSNPSVRVAAGPLMALARAVMDPAHGAVIAHADRAELLDSDDPRRQLVVTALNQGLATGVFSFTALESACDLVMGTTLEGCRRLAQSRRLDGAYLRETVAMVLIGLGLSRPAAQAAVAEAWQLLLAASDQLTWWQALQLA
jgi:AcrR family transcriptional regulator